jgi:outer membrane protein OmpA-like peptidoglycan-associated protein
MHRALLVLAACSAPAVHREPAPVVVVPVDAAAPDAERGRIVVTSSDECGFILDMVYFPSGAVKPETHQTPVLEQTAEMLKCLDKQGPRRFWEIQGHADSVEQNGQSLSEVRAGFVRDALVLLGVDPSGLRTKGYGATQPLDKRNTEAARAKNRRVMFINLGPRP